MKALYGLEFAPIVSITSSFRKNSNTGLDSSREHVNSFMFRPSGYGRNSLRTTAKINVVLRALKMIAFSGGHLVMVAESFNLLNHRNVSLLNTSFSSGLQLAPVSQVLSRHPPPEEFSPHSILEKKVPERFAQDDAGWRSSEEES
jgi:hypothetical protein